MLPDPELLRRYSAESSEAAFAELVQRYIGLVYSAALRQVDGDAHRARDVAQIVFTRLSRKAASLRSRPSLAGWLHTTTRFSASELMRAERRRRLREQETQDMQEILSNEPLANARQWERLRPAIDTVLGELNDRDREAVLLRFFTNLPLAEVGATLNVSENTARMRVNRALGKLRVRLSRLGVTSTSGALAALLADQAAGSAPAGLAADVTSAVLVGVTSAGGGVATMALNSWNFMSTAKIIMGIGTILAIMGIGSVVYQSDARHRAEMSLAAVAQERDWMSAQLRTAEAAIKKSEGARLQLANLQSRLNRESRKVRNAPVTSAKTDLSLIMANLATGRIDFGSLANVGHATARSALESFLWAITQGRPSDIAKLITLTGPLKNEADSLYANLPADAKVLYSSPEAVIGLYVSNWATSKVPIAGTLQIQSEDATDDSNVMITAQIPSGIEHYAIQNSPNGWQLVVPAWVVDNTVAAVTGATNASAPK